MNANLENLLKEVRRLESAVAAELRLSEEALFFKIKNGKIRFDKEVAARHRLARISWYKYVLRSSVVKLVTAPVIYSLIFPAMFIDLMTSIYQAVCFPVYGIGKVRRSQYVVLDRHKLKYLNGIERLNCTYCGYFNGVIAFVREVAARTEQYWCPIRHAFLARGVHSRYAEFLPYGDERGYHDKLKELREKLHQEEIRTTTNSP